MKILKSTIVRLTLWYVAVLGLFLLLFAAATYLLFRYALTEQTDKSMTEIVNAFEKVVSEELRDPEEEQTAGIYKTAFEEAAKDVDFSDYRILVFSNDERLVVQTRAGDGEAAATAGAARVWLNKFGKVQGADFQDLGANGQTFRVMRRVFKHNGAEFVVLTVHNQRDRNNLLSRLRNGMLIGVPLALLFASLGGFFLARKSFTPIAKMTEKAEEITATNLHERLPVQNSADELGRLAAAFNQLLARLNLAFKQQRQFMADASHELRTPVAIVRGEAEVSLRRDSRTPLEYRETVEIVEKEAIKMSGIIEDLFMLARADAGENPVSKKSVYLEDILENSVKSFRTIASKRGITIEPDLESGLEVSADEYLLLRLFTNLIDNAVKHARSNVKVSAVRRNGNFVITVTDDGEGIPLENQPHIFERFYRADSVRSRGAASSKTEGAGLGLAISKWIAEAHAGTLSLAKSDSNGSVFIALIPATVPPQ